MTYDNDSLLAIAFQQDQIGRHAAIKSAIAAAAAYHFAMDGDDSQKAVLDTYGALLDAAGYVKGTKSDKRKLAKTVGEAFAGMFTAELASNYATEADFIAACFAKALADGCTTETRLMDMAVHGDPEHSVKAKAQAKAEKEAEKQAKAESALSSIMGKAADMGPIGDSADPVEPNEVRKIEPEPAADPLAYIADLSDDDLAALSKAVAAEKSRRTRAAKQAAEA